MSLKMRVLFWGTIIFLSCATLFPAVALSDAPIVVAGAGPASLMFSLRYLQLNPEANIEIFERRPGPARFRDTRSSECVAGDNAFGFGIGSRAQHTLKKIPGLFEAIEAVGHPLMFGGDKGLTAWLVNRRDLCAEFIHILDEEYGMGGQGRLKIHFGTEICDVRPVESESGMCRIVTRDSSGGDGHSVPFSLLVGSDGANSSVRACLLKKGYISGKKFSSGNTWKAMQMPPQPKLGHVKSSLAYKNKDDVGRLLPRYKNRFVLLNFRRKKATNQNPFGASTPEELKASLRAALPNVTEFPSDDIIQSFLDQPSGDTNYMILNKHYVPEMKTFLLGDAAVGMYSLLGQGCAYALESAALLAEELASASDASEFQSKLYECSIRNQKEGKALADLNLISHIRKTPVVSVAYALSMRTIMKGLGDPVDPYSAIARRSRWVILLSKPFWWFARSQSPLQKSDSRAI